MKRLAVRGVCVSRTSRRMPGSDLFAFASWPPDLLPDLPIPRRKKSSESGLQARSDSVRLSVLDAFFDTIRGACGNRCVPCASLSWCKLLHIRVRARGETGRERSKCQQLREIGFMATLEPRSLACIDNPSETGMDFQRSDVLFGKAWFVTLSWTRA